MADTAKPFAMRQPHDPRLTPMRGDVAASHLRNIVSAQRYVDGIAHQVIAATAPVRRHPAHDAPLETEALCGETVTIYDTDDNGWGWGQLAGDGYVGWFPLAALATGQPAPTHRVAALRTLGFPGRDIKLPPVITLPFGASVSVLHEQGQLSLTTAGYFLPTRHLAGSDATAPDFVATAARFLGTPYLWGGKTSFGIDCSGLVQISLHAAGLSCPRDSDMQEAALGSRIALDDADRGDLIFWKGHVGIVQDPQTLLHANAFHMAVATEPLGEAIARIAASGSDVINVKRLTA